MDECDLQKECRFYQNNIMSVPENSEDLKENYCRKNYLKCACYMVANVLGKDEVPEDLFPDAKTRAYLIIAENS